MNSKRSHDPHRVLDKEKFVPAGMNKEPMAWEQIRKELNRYQEDDPTWESGKVFTSIYPPNPSISASRELYRISREAAGQFLHTNLLHAAAWRSVDRFASDILVWLADLFQAPGTYGSATLGGSEGIFLAMKASRDRARAERGIETPEMVIPSTAYPTFLRAAHYMDIKVRRIPVGADYRADVSRMRDAMNSNTVLVVGSASCLPYGVVDPIEALGAMSAERGVDFHVDASIGGLQLPYWRKMGKRVPAFDFSVPGVTSIHADLHKFGYAPPGISVILHRSSEHHQFQEWVMEDWIMNVYRNRNLLGTHSGGAIAAAWAIMRYLGEDGFLKAAGHLWEATERMVSGINKIPGLYVIGQPDTSTFAIASKELDVRALAERVRELGWFPSPRIHTSPPAIHVTLSPIHAGSVDECLSDLDKACHSLRSNT